MMTSNESLNLAVWRSVVTLTKVVLVECRPKDLLARI